jgi:hypothetical protein
LPAAVGSIALVGASWWRGAARRPVYQHMFDAWEMKK